MTITSTQGIRCGHCKGRHATVANVRTCSRRANGAPTPSRSQGVTRVPEGRYAVRGDDGVIRFYYVTNKNFVKVQASDSLYRMSSTYAEQVRQAISQDISSARKLYAFALGRCWKCGRLLTDEGSRARGIGPVCESKI